MKPSWIKCDACDRLGTWWDLNTLACHHGPGCALDVPTAASQPATAAECATGTAICPRSTPDTEREERTHGVRS